MEHIQIALAEVAKGVKEHAGTTNNNPQILNYAFEAGLNNDGTDEFAWCSIFMNWLAGKAGLEKSNKVNARSWLTVGLEISQPAIGDIVVFWRGARTGWKGHVGIFYGFTNNNTSVNVLGGNQNNGVNIKSYSAHRVLGYRRLRKSQPTNGELRMGNKGEDVTALQNKLNMAGYNCGKVDGHFGKQTEAAIIKLQSFGQLPITGFYNAKTRELLEQILAKPNNGSSVNNQNTKDKPVEEDVDDWFLDDFDFDFDFE